MEKEAMENQRKYRILSLDGGGMRGIISARILKEIEEIVEKEHGQKLHEYFDLVAGTSTGSILAAGIACQMTAQDLIDLYKKDGQDIFISSVRWQRRWRWLTRFFWSLALYPHESKQRWRRLTRLLGYLGLYTHESKKKGLANVLRKNLKSPDKEEPTIRDIKEGKQRESEETEPIELLILAYDVLSRNTTWFASTPYNEAWYADLQLWKICTASASAPTFFPPYKLDYYSEEVPGQNIPHIDGGVSANNPALSAIAHALWLNKDKEKGSQLKTWLFYP